MVFSFIHFFIYPLFIIILNAEVLTFQKNSIPTCLQSEYYDHSRRPHISIISHDSESVRFFQNPELGARDASSILDVQIEWKKHYVNTVEKMKNDIYSAVDKGVDGIIVSIPNDNISEAVQYAISKNIPVIVFNTGLEYARKLGLTSVLQDNKQTGAYVGSELVKRGYNSPLVIQLNQFPDLTFNNRYEGLKESIGSYPGLFVIENYNNTLDSINQVKNILMAHPEYDSLLSIGGAIGTDIVFGAAQEVLKLNATKKLGVAFFDTGNNNMRSLFQSHKDVFGVSQLPYYQAALPVFFMYLRTTTGKTAFYNKTILTGPLLITNDTFESAMNDEYSTLLPLSNEESNIAAIIPNTFGDTFNGAIMAGALDLSRKLKWNILNVAEQGPLGYPWQIENEIKEYSKMDLSGLIIQSSEKSLLNQAADTAINKSIPLVTIGTFFEELDSNSEQNLFNVAVDTSLIAEDIATTVFNNNVTQPLCLSERTPWKESKFCDNFFKEFDKLQKIGNTTNSHKFIKKLNISSDSTMDLELALALKNMSESNATFDAYITLSEHSFNILNSRLLKGYLETVAPIYTSLDLFDQARGMISGHVNTSWYMNTYSMGFISILNILLSKRLTTQPWKLSLLDSPKIEYISRPGQHYLELSKSSYCLDEAGHTIRAIRATNCSSNTSSNEANLLTCHPCEYGTFSGEGATECKYCIDDDVESLKNPRCITFFQEKAAKRRRLYTATLVPILLTFFFICLGLCLRREMQKRKRRKVIPDENWILSYHRLIKPALPHLPSDPCSSIDTPLMSSNMESLPSYSVPSPNSPLSPYSFQMTHNLEELETPLHVNLSVDSLSVHSVEQVEKRSMLLEHNIGSLHNLPVFIKQIGFRKLKVDDTIREEVALMKYTRHPKLAEFIGCCTELNATYIVEEYCAKGSLADVLDNKDIDLTWIFKFSFINDLLEGLDFLQRSRFSFHGCLSSYSCLITGKWELKITDYGLSKVYRSQIDPFSMEAMQKVSSDTINLAPQDRVLTNNKTLLWVAPETVVSTPIGIHIVKPSKRGDIYSIGIIMNEILTRERPYQHFLEEGLSYENIFSRVSKEGLKVSIRFNDDDYTEKMNNVIKDCIQSDPYSRPTCYTLRNQMRSIDPYLSEADYVVDKLANLLEKYGNDMENLVKKRTSNLQQRTLELEEEKSRTQTLLKDLKIAKDHAEAAATAKQNFLANMSHEIRSPMNGVIGMSRILMESDLPPDLYECAETIESSGNHLMAIIDDILDYSKIESGKLSLEKCILDISFVIESAVKLVAPNFLDKDLVLSYEIDPNIPVRIYGDLVRLRQIILNLLSNAFKFTKSGRVEVKLRVNPDRKTGFMRRPSEGAFGMQEKSSITTEQSDIGEDYVPFLVSVKDSGIGIPKDKSDKLFQSFSQVDASTTRNFGGTGLGLAISRQLCRMMGGDMWVDSDEGLGSTFTFQVLLQKQIDSPTYRVQYHLKKISSKCNNAVVVTEKQAAQDAWDSLLSSFEIQKPKAISYEQALILLDSMKKEEDYPSILIIDVDLCTIQAFGAQPTNSITVLDDLRAKFGFLHQVPTLCVTDVRLRKMTKAERTSSTIAQAMDASTDENSSTPKDEVGDPFDASQQSYLNLSKPFKNSKLLSALEHLARQKTSLEQTETHIRTHPDSSDHSPSPRQRSHSFSSSSSGKPLADILPNLKVLLVDDNPVNRKVMTRTLTRMGIEPLIAQNGREACEAVVKGYESSQPIDLIFMDIWMPEMNGLEAAFRIRNELAETQTKPYIIAMTACVMPGDREKCIDSGMNGYVSKPVRKQELEAALHTFAQVLMTDEETICSHLNTPTNDMKKDTSIPIENQDGHLPNNDANHLKQAHNLPVVTITSEEDSTLSFPK